MTGHLKNLIDRLKRDRKLAVMACLVMVAMLLWGRLLLNRPIPQVATARPSGEAVAANSPATVGGEQGLVAGEDRAVVAVSLPGHLSRDLFSFPTERSAWAGLKNSHAGVEREKSGVNWSDDQLRSATVRKAAENLQLRSVMMGETPSAVINGRVLRLGQQIQGFTLLQVSERYVLLEQHGVIVRLKM